MKPLLGILILLICWSIPVTAQEMEKDTMNSSIFLAKLNPTKNVLDSTHQLTFSGYIDTYYSYYSDTVGLSGFAKFPTSAPRQNQFGLNILQFSAKYVSKNVRANGALFFGDIPSSSWSPQLNFIQEANVGCRIFKRLWLDAGFFRTHIGMESIQPRENITSSFATLSYFESYYMSGAKLTWEQSRKWQYQVNIFNGFNNFIDNNSNKAIGFSIVHKPKRTLSFTLNSLLCDEYPDGSLQRHLRHYTNFVSSYKAKKLKVAFEANFGYQENSNSKDSTKVAFVVSGALATKYRFSEKWASYGRFELFSDPNQVLTGTYLNNKNEVIGLNLIGGTVGIEFNPIPTTFLRIESRLLRTKRDEMIFYCNNTTRNYRWEGIVSFGIWF